MSGVLLLFGELNDISVYKVKRKQNINIVILCIDILKIHISWFDLFLKIKYVFHF